MCSTVVAVEDKLNTCDIKRYENPKLKLRNISMYCLWMLMKTFLSLFRMLKENEIKHFLRIQRITGVFTSPDINVNLLIFHWERLERCNYNIRQREIQKSFNPPFFQYVDYTFSDLFFLVFVCLCVISCYSARNATSGQQAFCKHAVYDYRRMFFSLNSIMFCRKQTVKLSLDTPRGMQMMASFLHLSFYWTIRSIHELLECWLCLSECDRWTALVLIMCKHFMLWSNCVLPLFVFLNCVGNKNTHTVYWVNMPVSV